DVLPPMGGLQGFAVPLIKLAILGHSLGHPFFQVSHTTSAPSLWSGMLVNSIRTLADFLVGPATRGPRRRAPAPPPGVGSPAPTAGASRHRTSCECRIGSACEAARRGRPSTPPARPRCSCRRRRRLPSPARSHW